MELGRREFITLSALCLGTAGLGLSGCSKKLEASTAVSETPIKKVISTCGNCHNDCGILVSVQDGVIVAIEGDPDHPFNKGALCSKGLSFLDVAYSPDRLKYPMKRIGDKGSNQWQRVSWDEAYKLMADRLGKIKTQYGPQALLFASGAPVQNIVRNAFCEFYARYGTVNSVNVQNLCYAPRAKALGATYGFRDEEDYVNTDLMIIWGANPFASMRPGSYMCYETHGFCSPLLDAKERGAKLIVIDPVFTETASKADQFIPIRPATDGALALAMGNVIVNEGLYDKDFVANWCSGFDQYKAFIQQYTPQWAEGETGIPANTIAELARLYAKTKKAVLKEGNNFSLHSNVTQAVRAIGILRALTGHLDTIGSSVCFPNVLGYPKPVEIGTPVGMKTTVTPSAPHINAKKYPILPQGMPGAIDAIATGLPYQPRAMMIYHSNVLLGQAGYPWLRAQLQKLDFVVVVDLFMTDTAVQLADLVLPDACGLERYDYRTYPSYKGTVISLKQPVIKPAFERKTSYDMEYELSGAMGLQDNFPWKTQEQFIDYALSPSGHALATLKDKSAVFVGTHEYKKYETGGLRADGKPGFQTADGKVMLYSTVFEKAGYSPLPTYGASLSLSPNKDRTVAQFPLVAINRRMTEFVHSKYRNNPYTRELHPDPEVTLNTADAAARGITAGAWVTVSNNLAKTYFVARISERIMPGTVWIDGCFGDTWSYPQSNMNALIDMRECDPITQCPDLLSFRVEVTKN